MVKACASPVNTSEYHKMSLEPLRDAPNEWYVQNGIKQRTKAGVTKSHSHMEIVRKILSPTAQDVEASMMEAQSIAAQSTNRRVKMGEIYMDHMCHQRV